VQVVRAYTVIDMPTRFLALLLASLALTEALRLQPRPVQPVRAARRPLAAASPLESIRMQGDGAFEKTTKRGKSATIARPKPKPKNKRKEDVDKEPMWRVLLHNDDVHTWDYVIFAIVSVVKTITRKKAHRITTQVHTMGTATVTVSWKQQAKQYCLKLQEFGLTSSISPEPQ